ncbi:hypothetical protein Godav_004100, partial [Gossypium davidsonii]|nr:hypothetical protein [Gossypium davidsonii]
MLGSSLRLLFAVSKRGVASFSWALAMAAIY